MKVSKSGEYGACNVQLNGEKMEELNRFRYLGVDLSSNGEIEVGWKYKVGEGRRLQGL